MKRVLLIAGNVFRGILYRRIMYLWLFAIGLLVLRSAAPLLFDFGNPALQDYVRRRALSGGLDTWSSLCIALAIFMGATAIGSEISGKTIVTLFARPIHRWEFLVGKWIGVQCFTLLAFGLGVVAGLGLARYLEADVEWRVLGYALAQTVLGVALYSGTSLALSAFLSSGVAGALTVILVFLPAAVEPLRDSDDALYHNTGVVLDYVVPPGYTSHYTASIPAPLPLEALGGRGGGFGGGGFGGPGGGGGFGGGGGRGFGRGGRRGVPPFIPQAEAASPDIDDGDETTLLLENLGYAILFFGLGNIAFLKKDLRLG